jgi:UTP-glucose-1-phosphate uridylyltransferase
MSLDVETLRFATEEMPHTGYIIPELIAAKIPVSAQEMNGNYYDCGTPTEYIRMLATELIHLDG